MIPEPVANTGVSFNFGAVISMISLSHPFTCDLLSSLNVAGVTGVLAPVAGSLQRQQAEYAVFARTNELVVGSSPFQIVQATEYVRYPFPLAEFDFSAEGSYSQYNWEVFFHAPLMIANRLRSEGRYEAADRWYRFIFDPLHGEEESITGPERFWMVKPLFKEARAAEPDVIQALFSTDGFGADPATLTSFVKSVARWLYEPFNPHAIASVRSGTYRWVAVRGYLDNLIDWADALFRRDSIESINEAAQLYLLAAALLGPKPERVQHSNVQVERYSTIDFPGLFGGLAEVEGFYPEQSSIGSLQIGDGPTIPVTPPEPPTYDTTLTASVGTVRPPISPGATDFARETREVPPYQPIGGFQQLPPSGPPAPLWWTFCLPPNPQLLAYWDTVADRLFKIRNCMNIEGVERSLALFEAPIYPALLVRARAAGVDLTSAIDGLNAPLPTHRYRVLVGRAIDFCNDVKALGGALLSALEKRDAEALSHLRATHETAVLKRMRQVREQQVAEASAQIEALNASEKVTLQRETHFTSLLEEGLLQAEEDQTTAIGSARDTRSAKRDFDLVSSVFAIYPNLSVGTTGFSTSFGSTQLSAYFTFLSEALYGHAFEYDADAQLAQIEAGNLRRAQEWTQQKELARLEKLQIAKQIAAADIRKEIAVNELSNLERQIEQAEEIEAFYRDKFTGRELYDWMIGEISRLYFQAYKLAFDMAKKAERAMQFELETSDSFIEFGYWDGLKKGLMAGERLHLDIKRM